LEAINLYYDPQTEKKSVESWTAQARSIGFPQQLFFNVDTKDSGQAMPSHRGGRQGCKTVQYFGLWPNVQQAHQLSAEKNETTVQC